MKNGNDNFALVTTKREEKIRKKIPPDLEEVEAFIAEHSYPVNAEKFWNHYQANGWMVGKNRMKDWHAAVRTWAAGARERAMPERNGKLAI